MFDMMRPTSQMPLSDRDVNVAILTLYDVDIRNHVEPVQRANDLRTLVASILPLFQDTKPGRTREGMRPIVILSVQR